MRSRVFEGLLMAFMVACLPHFVKAAAPQQEEKTPAVPKEKVAVSRPRSSGAFRVEYSIRELEDGKRINSRTYKLLVQRDEWGRIRVGSRVPYMAGEKQINYADVGINIDSQVVEEQDADVVLHTTYESNSLAKEDRVVASGISNPVFRNVRTQSTCAVPFGKPTVINVVDDVASSRQYEIEVTVTKVK